MNVCMLVGVIWCASTNLCECVYVYVVMSEVAFTAATPATAENRLANQPNNHHSSFSFQKHQKLLWRIEMWH